jgi:hypothetical protein
MVLQYYKIFGAAHGARAKEVVNRVRFLFCGAEELGLLGTSVEVCLCMAYLVEWILLRCERGLVCVRGR